MVDRDGFEVYGELGDEKKIYLKWFRKSLPHRLYSILSDQQITLIKLFISLKAISKFLNAMGKEN